MPRSLKSFLFPDVNVWVALTCQGHSHHAVARKWFEGLHEDVDIAFCRFTQLSLLRLLTTRAVMLDEVMTQIEAWAAYDAWLRDDRVILLEEPANLEPSFRALSKRHHPDSKIWADAYLAAFASLAGLELVTFDRAPAGRIERVFVLNS
jgi:uncharacterized protein